MESAKYPAGAPLAALHNNLTAQRIKEVAWG
jgi:hypothetical protein